MRILYFFFFSFVYLQRYEIFISVSTWLCLVIDILVTDQKESRKFFKRPSVNFVIDVKSFENGRRARARPRRIP